jgi:hypothetical protein
LKALPREEAEAVGAPATGAPSAGATKGEGEGS